MRTERLGFKVAYAAHGADWNGKVGWHAVSEDVAVDVPVLDDVQVPLVAVVTRPTSGRTLQNAKAYDAAAGRGRTAFPQEREEFGIRLGADGPMAPLMGASGRAPLRVEHLAVETAFVQAANNRFGPGRLSWGGYPGERWRTMTSVGRDKRWPEPVEGDPGCPVWACWDVGLKMPQGHDGASREAAVDSIMAVARDLRVVGGQLWRPCGTPVACLTMSGRARLCVPGHDDASDITPDYGVPLAWSDYRTASVTEALDQDPRGVLPLRAADMVRTFEGYEFPPADVCRHSLGILAGRVRDLLSEVAFPKVPRSLWPCLAHLDDVPGLIARGADPEALAEDTRVILARGWDAVPGLADGTVDPALVDLSRFGEAWGRVVGADLDLRRALETEAALLSR